MRRRIFVLLAALLPLAGCHHRAPKVAAAPPPPDLPPVTVSVPPPTHTSELPPTAPVEPVQPAPVAAVPAPPKKPRRRKPAASAPSTTTAATAPAPAPPVQVAAAASPAFALGQLSAGDDNGRSLRSETETLLAAQRTRLEKLPPAVAAAHASDVDQARRFLKGADDAWKAGDVEGAHTLAVKARVLLDDLGK